MSRTCFIILSGIILILLFCFYYTAPFYPDELYISLTLILVFIAIGSSSLSKKEKGYFGKNMFTLKNMFILGFLIVFFQMPLDYVLGYNVDENWFFERSLFNKSVIFSAICLVLLLLGYRFYNHHALYNKKTTEYHLNGDPSLLIIISWILFLLFFFTVDKEFFIGGYGGAGDGSTIGNKLAGSFFGHLINFLQITLIQILWNAYRSDKIYSIRSYNSLFPFSFKILYGGVIVLWLMSGGRAYALILITSIAFGYFILSKGKLRFSIFVGIIITIGFLLTIFKGMGGLLGTSFNDAGTQDAFLQSKAIFENSIRDKSFFPYTWELSGSIYANNILFYYWYNGISFKAIPLLMSLLRIIPGGVSLFLLLTGWNMEMIKPSDFIQTMTFSQYGLGNACVGDMLISIGMPGTLIVFFLLGFFFRKMDSTIYCSGNSSLFLFTTAIASMGSIIFLSRSSLFVIITNSLFFYLILRLNMSIKHRHIFTNKK